MSWLTPERRAQFQQLQQLRLAEENAGASTSSLADHAIQVEIINVKPDGQDDAHGETGRAEKNRENWQRPVAVLSGPEGITSRQEEIQEERERNLRIEQQSSGNIAKKLYDEEHNQDVPLGSRSTPALHLEHFSERPVQLDLDLVHLAKNKSSKKLSGVQQLQSKASSSKPIDKNGFEKRSAKSLTRTPPKKTAFFDASGTYRPPPPTAVINTTRTHELRQQQLKTLNTPKSSVIAASRPSIPSSGGLKEQKATQPTARKETYDHAARIMNSRTDHRSNLVSPTLSAAERYQNFVRSSTNSASPKRGNAAKQRMVEKKMDDVFRRLNEDAVSPPLPGAPGQANGTKTLKEQERNWNRPNPLKTSDLKNHPTNKHTDSLTSSQRILSHQKLPSDRLLAPLVKRKTDIKTVIRSSEKKSADTKKSSSKAPVSHNGMQKKKAKIVQESEDDVTSTSNFSTASADSSAISFPTEATSATSGTSNTGTSHSKQKKKKKGTKKSDSNNRQSLYAVRLSSAKPTGVNNRSLKSVSGKAPIAFGRALPRPGTPGKAESDTKRPTEILSKLEKTVATKSLPKASLKTVAKKEPVFNELSTSSEDTSAEYSVSSQHLSDLSEDSDETTSHSRSDQDHLETPQRSAEDIVKSLADKWREEKATSKNGFVSNSQTFYTPDIRNSSFGPNT